MALVSFGVLVTWRSFSTERVMTHVKINVMGALREDGGGRTKAKLTGDSRESVGLEHVTLSTQSDCSAKRYVAYFCDNCGDIADMQKGILTAYLIAVMLERKFVINVTQSCGIEKLWQPNKYDWTECRNYALNVPQHETAIYQQTNGMHLKDEMELFINREINTKVLKLDLTSFAFSLIKHHLRKVTPQIFRWMTTANNADIVYQSLTSLFRPTKELQKDSDWFIDRYVKEKKLICAYVPYANAKGNRTNEITMGNVVTAFFAKRFTNSSKYVTFIGTDLKEVQKHASLKLPNFRNVQTAKDTQNHIYKSGRFEKCEMDYTILLEQLILSQCDLLVIPNNSFGLVTAYMRQKQGGLFMYDEYLCLVRGVDVLYIGDMFQ